MKHHRPLLFEALGDRRVLSATALAETTVSQNGCCGEAESINLALPQEETCEVVVEGVNIDSACALGDQFTLHRNDDSNVDLAVLCARSAGEEIYPDKYGRSKVQFAWKPDEPAEDKSSCWILVSQMHASDQVGTKATSSINDEAILEFVERTPDQFFMLNQIVRDHYVNARTRHVANNKTIQIGTDRTQTVGGDHTVNVSHARTCDVGLYQSSSAGNERCESVGSNHSHDTGDEQTSGKAKKETTLKGKNVLEN